MSLISILVAFLGLLASPPAPPTYRAVVIDAVTRNPLASVTVQEVTGGSTCVTNQAGLFNFPLTASGTLKLHLSSLGYAPADFARTATDVLDTLRLEPASAALPGVVVRPGRQVLLTPFTRQPHLGSSYYLIPSVQVAVHLAGLPEGQTGRINQLQLQLKPTAIRAGALRISLRALGPEGAAAGPVGSDLLPTPLEISTAQLATAPKGLLTLDLSSYNLDLPAAGVFVLVEGLGSEANQHYVSLSNPGNGHSPLLVTGADPKDPKTYQVTRLNDYPVLGAAETDDPARTWLLGSNGRGWRLYQPKDGKTRTKNSLVSLLVQAN
ncbi:hypothetical protein GKZ68_20510 (plasmid) [Hymenobacter sp. BRD128]|uniref:hypothetical protein n=1 Tax=Hymenobacter sp. BRD128 TaxID=2675878 RepID=UPI0015641A71|nr:hypothetical protein [Hymenobacter sp. BRD128]QKG59067.1 hypothetical protein GKZ68_20510 [Hymenobacter sp. BRD128]